MCDASSFRTLIDRYADLVCEMRACIADRSPVIASERNCLESSSCCKRGTVLLFSPHPDDECMAGPLPLRLKACGFRIVNVAVTLGSKPERKGERLNELHDACKVLGYDLVLTGPTCSDAVTQETRDRFSGQWNHTVDVLCGILARENPCCIFVPHEHDAHKTHRGTYLAVVDALEKTGMQCMVVLTEYWRDLDMPNLMVEVSRDGLAVLVAGTMCHRGEIRRNPYYAFLPARMNDNVRRGSELLGGAGVPVVDMMFAVLYRRMLWNGQSFDLLDDAMIIRSDDDAARMLER